MSYTTECMTPADIAAVTRNNDNDGMFGGDGAWQVLPLYRVTYIEKLRY